jgi:hypothetical protein
MKNTDFAMVTIGAMPAGTERVGFEPTVPHRGTTVFETAPIDRSGTSPLAPAATSCAIHHRSTNKASQHTVGDATLATKRIFISVGAHPSIPEIP